MSLLTITPDFMEFDLLMKTLREYFDSMDLVFEEPGVSKTFQVTKASLGIVVDQNPCNVQIQDELATWLGSAIDSRIWTIVSVNGVGVDNRNRSMPAPRDPNWPLRKDIRKG